MASLYEPILRLARLLIAAFFSKVEVIGVEHVPPEGGGIVVSWHPNGLVDPALIFATFPRRLVFGARDGLFRVPLLGWLIKAVGTIPIYRAMDREEMSQDARRKANRRSLEALARAVAGGGVACLFPEGDSHDAPYLLALKTGVARFYYQARRLAPEGARPPVILPVGLHYNDKRGFRSSALVTFHPPMEIPPDLDLTPPEDEPLEVAVARTERLTAEIDRVLCEVVHATESWRLHHLLHRSSKLIRAERAHRAGADLDAPDMVERQYGFARIWAGYNAWLHTRPDEIQQLMERVADYDRTLRALGMEDDELDRAPKPGRLLRAALLVAQVVAVYLVMPWLLVLGGVINLGPMLVIKVGTTLAARKDKDVATLMVAGGAVLYPLTWLASALLGAWLAAQLHALYPVIPSVPWLAGLVVVTLGILGGMVALRYLRLLRNTARAMRVRLTRARRRLTLANLRVERDELADALEALEEGMDLPGSVTALGAVVPTEEVPPGGRR